MTNDCPHNPGITCDPAKRHCATCGWSPNVHREIKPHRAVKNPQQGPTRSKRVAKVDAHGRVVEVYSSENMAAKENGISRTAVRQRCTGETTRFTIDLGGYTFRYVD